MRDRSHDAVEAMRPQIAATVDRLIDEMEVGPFPPFGGRMWFCNEAERAVGSKRKRVVQMRFSGSRLVRG
jgi:hypothetical protein